MIYLEALTVEEFIFKENASNLRQHLTNYKNITLIVPSQQMQNY